MLCEFVKKLGRVKTKYLGKLESDWAGWCCGLGVLAGWCCGLGWLVGVAGWAGWCCVGCRQNGASCGPSGPTFAPVELGGVVPGCRQGVAQGRCSGVYADSSAIFSCKLVV